LESIAYHKMSLWKIWTIIVMLWMLLFQGELAATPLVGVNRLKSWGWLLMFIRIQLLRCRVSGAWEQWSGGGCMFYHQVEFD
jgi:hypothetical protein